MDVHSPQQRSFNMSKIKGKDTAPEKVVRKWLWSNGYRYRLHRKDLPGTPDITLPRYRVAIFVNGCFWHRHGCYLTTTPDSRREFWLTKFSQNISRDQRNIKALLEQSWRVLVIWECSLRGKNAATDFVAEEIASFLDSDTAFAEIGT